MLFARQTDEYDRTPEQYFKRHNRAHPERGGAEKATAFWHWKAVKQHRVLISDILNTHLERNGSVERVHPGTLESRGIDRQPEPKLLPSQSREYREEGKISKSLSGNKALIREELTSYAWQS